METPEGHGEGGAERPGSSRIPPIATTPPRRGWKEEIVSQSSSGTQISNASGISLGEAIRHQSAINRDMETWYQPYTEIETSHSTTALGRRLGQTSRASGLMEFPTMEGGPITPSDESRRHPSTNVTHTPLLDVQDSRLSPNLPLLTTYSTQGRTFFNETLFQSLGTDFAPLRGTPDVSSAAHEASRPLQMHEAVRLAAQDVTPDVDCTPLSQHPFTLSTVTPSNASPGSCLSQYPLCFSRQVPLEWRYDSGEQSPHFGVGNDASVSEDRNPQVHGTQKSPPAAPLPPEGTAPSHDPFLLDSTVPAPLLLEMLEKEVGLPTHRGFLSSSESSSCKSLLGKDPEENGTSWLTENRVLAQREPEAFAALRQEDSETVPELDASPPFSVSEGKPFTSASLPGRLSAKTPRAASANKGHGRGSSCVIPGMLPRALLDQQQPQQVSDAVTEESKQDRASSVAHSRRNVPVLFQATVSATHSNDSSKQANAVALGIQTRVGKKDLTLLGCSIEREHKYTGISPSFTEGSFFGYLAHPLNHSTPGTAPAKALAQKAPGLAPPVQSALQPPPPSFHMETSAGSHATTCIPSVEKLRGPSVDDTLPSHAEEPPTLRSEQEAATGNSEELQALHPLKGRIQSLPSLNFMEKVGVWNTSQSAEKMSDALALQSPSWVSPRQKAYADSLNHILLKQHSQMKRQEGLAASFSSSSVASLRHLDRKPPSPFPLTRSRSENSVIAVGWEVSRADAGKQIEKEEDFRLADDEDAVSEAPAATPSDPESKDPRVPRYTAVLVSTVLSDEETVDSVGGETDLKRFITSERVAELLREETTSPSGDREKTGSCWGDAGAPPCAHLSSSQLSMDHFSDVSPDSLNHISSSATSSCVDVRLSSRQLSVLSGESRASSEDVSLSRSPVRKTPDNREINIEERIPVYLRNLGIDQSPSSILTPFLPRGPVREIEFSPSELRTMKASTDALGQFFQTSEGDSRSVVDVTQSTFDSSTLSVPVPAGSDAGPNISLPTDLLPKSSRELLGQGSIECPPGVPCAPTPRPSESITELPAAPQPAELSQGISGVPASLGSAEERSTERIQVPVDRFNPQEPGAGQDKLSSASVPEEEGQTTTHEQPHSSHINSSGEKDRDSFAGSKTLKEIQGLLAQAEARSPSCFVPVSSSVDPGSPLTRTKKAGGCGVSGSVQENSPGLQRAWSWDETLARQSVHEDTSLSKALHSTGSLKWEGTLSGDVVRDESGAPEEPRAAFQGEGLEKSAERSEPEGCNSATGAGNLLLNPLLLKSAAGSDLCPPEESQTALTAEPSGSVSDILEGFQRILEKAGETGSKGAGSVHGSENSSSLDSLGIRVKHILRGGYPANQAAEWTEDWDGHGQSHTPVGPSLSFGRQNASVRGSEQSSSVDSLAARVKALLETERPVMHAAQILRRAEEEERRALLRVKLTLAAESPNSAFDLNEEDRQKIEEIKTELLLSGRKAEIQDRLWGNSYEGIPSPFQKPEMGHSVVPNDTELHMGIWVHDTHIAAFPVEVRPPCRADRTLPRDSELKPLNSAQSDICPQLQTCADKPVDPSASFHAHLGPDRGTCLSALSRAPKAHTGEEGSVSAEDETATAGSPTEAAKQITSITFASRKRSPPPPPASPAPPAGLTEAAPHDPGRLEAKSIGSEQPGPGGRPPDARNPSAPASSAAAFLRDDAGLPLGGDGQPMPLIATGDESPQSKGTVSEENPQTRRIEQKVHFFTGSLEEAVAAAQVFTEPRGNDRPLSGGHNEKAGPGGKVADRPLPVNLPPQTTDSDCPPVGFSGSLESFRHDPSRLGDADPGNGVLLPSSSPDYVSAAMPGSPSSPTRKALSGVHITLSPKRISVGFANPAAPEAEMRQGDGPQAGSHPVASGGPSLLSETTPKLKPSELPPQAPDSAYFPRGALPPGPHSSRLRSSEVVNVAGRRSQETLENRPSCPVPDQESTGGLGSGGQNRERNLKITVSSQTEKLSSDAITQITTESPEKTTYSAEIFVSTDNNGESGAAGSSRWKSREILRTAPPAPDQAEGLDRQAGKPLLLPYKPPGSSEMYYVPCTKEILQLSRIRSGTTVESSHSGSNDAIPPEFPTRVLGSRGESPTNTIALKHKEGIYSKRVVPKVAWTEEKAAAQDRVEESAQTRNPLEPVQATHSVFGSAQFYLHHPVPLQHEIDFHAGREALEQSTETERPVPPPRDFVQRKGRPERSQPPISLHQPTAEQRFSPLVPELDYSLIQELPVERDSPRKEARPEARRAGHRVAKDLPLPGSRMSRSREQQAADLPHRQTVHFTNSLDELWSKYLERHQQQRHPGSRRAELSLVERLDRLARLLQNPARHSLMPAEDEQSDAREKGRRRELKKTRSHGKAPGSKSNPASQADEGHDTTDGSRLSNPRRHLSGETEAAARACRILEQSLDLETPSDTSKGSSVLTDISASESDAATQEESVPPTEASGSVSSIDTARLVWAFGHDRVRVTPKLSQLYSTIGLQRSRSEKRAKESRRAPGADPPKMARPEHKRKGSQAMYPVSSSDSVSTPGSSRGPSFALSHKRTTRMLNKAVQAGDFEIVNSATKKHTRDVGLTFPTPTSSQTKLRGDRWNEMEGEFARPDGLLPGNKGKLKRQPRGWLAEKRTTRNMPKCLQGVSWFVSAEDLKSDPKKETGSSTVPELVPSWFKPLTRTKLWREPLREMNWPEDPRALQEALALRRPDFISRSGERVKRLKLIMEERKLQNTLQSEREQLFNPPDERRAYRDGLVPSGGHRVVQRARSISKSEMVQRSKRIYEQLPEVRKRREDEKRKSDYLTYRLKAQRYKTKITNHILGRKVPWE